jgi:hypothetical protein
MDVVPTLTVIGLRNACSIAAIGTKVWDVERCCISGGEFKNELITLLVTS